jgi:hypothetical protein
MRRVAEVLPILAGLDHGCAAVDEDRLAQLGVTVAADDHVDARHGLGHAHVVAVSEAKNGLLAFFSRWMKSTVRFAMSSSIVTIRALVSGPVSLHTCLPTLPRRGKRERRPSG